VGMVSSTPSTTLSNAAKSPRPQRASGKIFEGSQASFSTLHSCRTKSPVRVSGHQYLAYNWTTDVLAWRFGLAHAETAECERSGCSRRLTIEDAPSFEDANPVTAT